MNEPVVFDPFSDDPWERAGAGAQMAEEHYAAQCQRLREALRDLIDVQYDFPTNLTPNPDYFKAFHEAARVLEEEFFG